MPLNAEDRVALAYAKMLLEGPSLAVRLAALIGEPLERGMRQLPANWRAVVEKASVAALQSAAGFALGTLRDDPYSSSHDWWHKAAAATSGALGGAGGLALVGVELPLSTTIMLRSIAAIARSEGHQLRDPEVRLACLEVFALGGTSVADDATKTGYYAVRTLLAQEVAAATRHLAEKGLTDQGAPVIVRLLAKIASRYGLVVSEKVAAQAVPVLGAVGGMTVNTVFLDHFQKMAYGHFIIRRLEADYGAEQIRAAYEEV